MALQEVHWQGAGEMMVDDHTIIWSGLPEGSVRQSGMALVLDRKATFAFKAWYPLSDRVLLAQFRYSVGLLSVVAAYAPTNEAPEDVKDTFYWTLEHAAAVAGTGGTLVCLDDFNAVPGTNRTGCSHVLGPFRSGSANDNTERLIDFCLGAGLRIGGSWFQRKDIHRMSWYSNDGHIR